MKFFLKNHTQNVMEKLVPDPLKNRNWEHICRSTVWNVIQFVFIACTSGGLLKYITVVSRYLEYPISQSLLYFEQYTRSLGQLALDQTIFQSFAVFFRYLKLFPKFPKVFAIFLLKLVFFQLPLEQLLELCWQWWKALKSNYFCSFFDRMFWFDFLISRIFNKCSL